MVTCAVPGCNSSHKENTENYTFHIFPNNCDVRKKWIEMTNRENWAPKKFSKICSKHFDQKCFSFRGPQRVKLRSGSIPTLFMPVKESKRAGATANDVHTPNLWYYSSLSFLDKRGDQSRSGLDSLASEEESIETESAARPKRKLLTLTSPNNKLEQKKIRLIETAQELLHQERKKRNSFGAYIGEQLEQLSKFQRPVAERLISEVIFLAKTENLNYDSKIETPSRSCNSKFPSSPPSDYILSIPQCNQPSASQSCPSTQHMKLSPLHTQMTFSPEPSPPPFTNEENVNENPDSTILKELLIKKEPS